MLHRVIYASDSVGTTGDSVLSIAQILGVSERNNRRDHLTGCIMFHNGHILQAVEGGRGDLDRLLRRLRVDPRHRDMKVLVDQAIAARTLMQPMDLCAEPGELLRRIGLTELAEVTPEAALTLVEMKAAA